MSGQPGDSDGSVEFIEEVVYEEVTDDDEQEEEEEEQQQQQLQQGGASGASHQITTPPTSTAAAAESPANKSPNTAEAAESAAAMASPVGSLPPVSTLPPLSPNPAGSSDAAASGSNTHEQQQQLQFSTAGDFDLLAPNVEQQASKVAAELAEFAGQVTHKLQDGIMHAFSSNTQQEQQQSQLSPTAAATDAADAAAAAATAATAAAAAAAAGLSSKLTGGLTGFSSWWSNLDKTLAANNAPPTAPGGNPEDKLSRSTAPESSLCVLFGLAPDESLVESYDCCLLQTYCCATNSITPPMQVVFEGTLHITDRHCCFQAKEQQQQQQQQAPTAASGSSGGSNARKRPPVAFKIVHSDVEAATREPNPRRTLAASDLLQIVVNPASPDSSSGLAPGQPGKAGLSAGIRSMGGQGLAPVVHSVARGEGSKTAAAVGGAAAAAAAAVGGAAAADGGGGKWAVVFQDFKPSSGLDGALALIEHLRDSS